MDAPARPLRADAARNRTRVLDAARTAFAESGLDVGVEVIARRAGVGKGTLYRRFGDRAGLALALLDAREREFQEEVIRGPAPLGPGAPPVERIIAFGRAWLDLLDSHGDIVLAAESGPIGARFRSRVYASHRAHLELLIAEARPGADAGYLADALLAALDSELVLFMRTDRGRSLEEIKAGWQELARSAVRAPV
jgi:AcrR family transcriptional regulator